MGDRRRGLKPGQLVLIEWMDSVAPNEMGWMDPDELDTVVNGVRSVGWVQLVDGIAVTIIHNHDQRSGNVNGAMTIPLVSITAVKKLG